MRRKFVDIISEKQNKLAALQAQAEDAIDLVTKTISSLELTNQEIDDTMAEIDGYIAKLNETRSELDRNHNRNAAVIKNFTKLIEVDDAA